MLGEKIVAVEDMWAQWKEVYLPYSPNPQEINEDYEAWQRFMHAVNECNTARIAAYNARETDPAPASIVAAQGVE